MPAPVAAAPPQAAAPAVAAQNYGMIGGVGSVQTAQQGVPTATTSMMPTQAMMQQMSAYNMQAGQLQQAQAQVQQGGAPPPQQQQQQHAAGMGIAR